MGIEDLFYKNFKGSEVLMKEYESFERCVRSCNS